MTFWEIWSKNDFFNVISKKRPFSRNVDIFGYMDKVISKKHPFSRNVDIFADMGKKRFLKGEKIPFSDIWLNNEFFKENSK